MISTKTDKNLGGIHAGVKLGEKFMPAEIKDTEKFIEMSARAKSCAVKRLKSSVKLKLRTPGKLYTLKVEPGKAEETIKKLKCEILEL